MESVDPLMGIILPYANFALFLTLAIIFFRKPARQAAAKKKAEFDGMVAEAIQAKEAADKRLGELQNRYDNLQTEIETMVTTATQAAESEAARILADAERLAKHIRAEAERVAAAEVESARYELRREIVKAVHTTVEKRIKNDFSGAEQSALVKRRIVELQSLEAKGV